MPKNVIWKRRKAPKNGPKSTSNPPETCKHPSAKRLLNVGTIHAIDQVVMVENLGFRLKKVNYGRLPKWILDRIANGHYVQEIETGDVWNKSIDSDLAWDLLQWKQAQQQEGNP